MLALTHLKVQSKEPVQDLVSKIMNTYHPVNNATLNRYPKAQLSVIRTICALSGAFGLSVGRLLVN
jgi:hypothetical protein